MQIPSIGKLTSTLASAAFALMLSTAPVLAQHGGGGHVGGFGGYHGGGARGYGGYGYHGGYGYRGYGGYGYRGYGGWGWRGGGWGWGGLGLGLGLYFATLPYYYSTYWWGGVPYYYADDTYYRWDGPARQYVTVAPPEGLVNPTDGKSEAGREPPTTELMVYPKSGQNPEQIGKDKYDCHKWASSQTGFDPTQAGGVAPNRRSDYMRAQAACLEGRGYSVK